MPTSSRSANTMIRDRRLDRRQRRARLHIYLGVHRVDAETVLVLAAGRRAETSESLKQAIAEAAGLDADL